MSDMVKLEVGKIYPDKCGQPGIRLEYNGGFDLYIFLPDISLQESLAFSKGNYKFALTELKGILFFLAEFTGAMAISDAPFHLGLYYDDRYINLPDNIEEGKGLCVRVIVVDTLTKRVKALRLIGLPTDFSRELLDVCKRQSKEVVGKAELYHMIRMIQQLNSSKALYEMASVKCSGQK